MGGQLDHLESIFVRSKGPAFLVRGLAAGEKKDLIEGKRGMGLFGNLEVTLMDGVKGAAKERDAKGGGHGLRYGISFRSISICPNKLSWRALN